MTKRVVGVQRINKVCRYCLTSHWEAVVCDAMKHAHGLPVSDSYARRQSIGHRSAAQKHKAAA
jgi:hypothetical protein